MLIDSFIIIRKEWKEIFLQRGSLRGGLFIIVVILLLLGVFLPLQVGREWLNSTMVVLAGWVYLPTLLTMNMVADAFAGERERHTLETLLASRLSDRAILFGKMAAAVLYGFSMAFVAMLLGAVTVNLAYPSTTGGLLFYPSSIFVGGIFLTLLVNTLMTSLGVLVSLRAKTVRQAYQQLSIGLVLIIFLAFFGFQVAPNPVKAVMVNALSGWGVLGVLLVIDVVLIAAAMARFSAPNY